MPLKNKKFFAVIAAACLVFGTVGCRQNDDVSTGQEQTSAVSNNTILPKVKEEETEAETKSETVSETEAETTTAPQEAELDIETLAEGEERDWSVEDVLKNDLKIGGIPISIPCTLNEFLEALGDDYSVDEDDVKEFFDGEATTKSKYYTGEFLPFYLFFNGENTYRQIHAVSTNIEKIDYDDIYIIGYMGGRGRRNDDLGLSNLTIGDSLDKCIESYGKPNKVDSEDEENIYLDYEDDDCFITITIKDNVVVRIWAGFKTEDL